MSDLFTVVTFNQASGAPELEPGAGLHNTWDDAAEERDADRVRTAGYGRREQHYVARVTIEDDDEEEP